MKHTHLLSITLMAAAALACSTEPVQRRVSLESSASGIPAGSSGILGDELEVEFTSAEPLMDGKRHVLWAELRSSTIALAEIVAGAHTEVFPQDVGVAVVDIQEVLVTEEDAAGSLPTAPSKAVVVRGELPGPLMFGGMLMANDFAAAAGTADLEDDTIRVATSGLPDLPAGFRYDIWVGFSATAGGGSSTPRTVMSGGHGRGTEAAPQPLRIGALAGASAAFDTGRFLPVATEVRLTIESDGGHLDAAAAARVLQGAVVTTADESGGGAAESGGGSPEHLH